MAIDGRWWTEGAKRMDVNGHWMEIDECQAKL